MIFDLSKRRRWRRLRSSRPSLELHLSTGWYKQASCPSLFISASLSQGCSDDETEPLAGADRNRWYTVALRVGIHRGVIPSRREQRKQKRQLLSVSPPFPAPPPTPSPLTT